MVIRGLCRVGFERVSSQMSSFLMEYLELICLTDRGPIHKPRGAISLDRGQFHVFQPQDYIPLLNLHTHSTKPNISVIIDQQRSTF